MPVTQGIVRNVRRGKRTDLQYHMGRRPDLRLQVPRGFQWIRLLAEYVGVVERSLNRSVTSHTRIHVRIQAPARTETIR